LLVYDGADFQYEPGIHILKRTDTVGAGDTIASALAASLSAGATLGEAATFGNLAAAVTVQKLKITGTASPAEIMAAGADIDYIFRPEHAEDIRRASYLEGTRIEVVNPGIERGDIHHVVFDHDGTISTLRQGWEAIMEPMMVKAILGDCYEGASEEDWHRVVDRVRDVIDKSTGIQTILQMQALVELVAEYGFVPEDKILTPVGYKKIYNDSLMELIRERRKCLTNGELDRGDYTVKGSVDFLKAMHERGMTLYLASGTDEEDVCDEAQALGYADLFNGGIFGSVGDITKYSKKMVIERIITEHRLRGAQLACFGDGPVELRETRKRGGITIGVASDEIQRFGLNPEKRSRLILAGADLIIPDYTQQRRLIEYLWG
jgi:phosphoglycolate phosphatase-like HAD superfamily hydrolase